jgi:hypothetical protein
MAKPRLFISHVSEETALARLLKERLTGDFLDALEVFVSSDGKSIDAGEPWLKDVKTGLAKVTGSDAAKWADCFYGLLATGDHTLYKADDLTAANFPRARMVLIRHKDVRFKAEAVAAV